MPTLVQGFRYACSTETSLRCAVRIHSKEKPASVRSFVGDLIKDHSPPGISDGFGEHSARKPFDVQIFYHYQAEVGDQPFTCFVVEVTPLITDVHMGTLQKLNRFSAARRSTSAAADFTLCFAESTLCQPVVTRVVYLRAIAQRRKSSESDIYADSFSTSRQWLQFTFDTETREPVSRFALDCQRFNFAFHGAVQVDFDLANF